MPKMTPSSTTAIAMRVNRLNGFNDIPIDYKTYSTKRRFISLLVAIFLVVVIGGYVGRYLSQQRNYRQKMEVISVIDGDTIYVSDRSSQVIAVRLLGVDTPETHHPTKPVGCYGPQASDFTKLSLEHQYVELEYDKAKFDKYGRTLAYVYIRGIRFNDVLVDRGYAKVLSIAPNMRYSRVLSKLELDAKNNSRGLWGFCEN